MLAVCFFSTVVLFSAFLQVSGQSMELDNLSTDSLRIGIRLPVVGIDGNSAAICRTFDLSYYSKFANHRQHHPMGETEMLYEISRNFKLPEPRITKEKFQR